MIDLHGHLGVAVDDGPRTVDEARALADALLGAGVRAVACTSHVRPDKGWINDAGVQAQIHGILDEHLADIALTRITGAEHYVDDAVFGPGFEERVVPYGKSRYLLVETPYHGPPPDLFGLLARIRHKGFKILLAHVERFAYLYDKDDTLDRLLDAGHLIQVNLGSLAGAYSRAQQKAAERLLSRGCVSILAGDCHRKEDVEVNIVQGTQAALALCGSAMVHRLTVDNPQRILDDLPPHRIWP